MLLRHDNYDILHNIFAKIEFTSMTKDKGYVMYIALHCTHVYSKHDSR